MATLQPYKKYNPVVYDYATELPVGWQLLPNIAIFEERIERRHEKEELLSVTIGRGVIKQTELDKKDSSTADKSKYLLVHEGDLVYSMRFRQGASGYSNYKGIVSPACTVLKPRKNVKYNPRYFHFMLRTNFYKNYAERYAYGIADGQMPLRYTDFKRMYSIVPPLEVQNAIVEYLDKKNDAIEKFIRNKERFVELLEEEKEKIVSAAISQGVNENVEQNSLDEDWLKSIPKHWYFKPLKYLVKINQFALTEKTKPNYEIQYIDIGNVTFKGLVNEPEKLLFRNAPSRARRIVKSGDTIMSTVRTYLKAIAFL